MNIKYLKGPSTDMVLNADLPLGQQYIGDLWHDDERAALTGTPAWNINNGLVYLWNLPSREAAVKAMLSPLVNALKGVEHADPFTDPFIDANGRCTRCHDYAHDCVCDDHDFCARCLETEDACQCYNTEDLK